MNPNEMEVKINALLDDKYSYLSGALIGALIGFVIGLIVLGKIN